ncbi:hypothetical protein C2S51_006259 [Perilla frutescens var. frutescens]|nr:hypothetical protein C2S51_006259 [Perilla frutescens var. frutescens]
MIKSWQSCSLHLYKRERERERESNGRSKQSNATCHASPFAQRVKWALKLKGVEYDYIEEDLTNKSAALLQHNPVYKKVPVLVHGGKPVAESVVILEYIEETWPHHTPLLPKDPYERAMARFWIDYGQQKSSTFSAFLQSSEKDREERAAQVLETFKIIQDKALGDKKFFGGDSLSLVDLCFGWIASFERVERIVGVQVLEPKALPRLHRWMQDFKQEPVVKENMQDSEVQLKELQGVIWALKLKGVEYDYIQEDLSNKSAALLEYNPVHKKVPVLIHNGKPVAESAVILQYIEETWPDRTPLLPADPYERAMARFWFDFVQQKNPTITTFLLSSEEDKHKTATQVEETLKIIEDQALGDKKFFGGNTISMVDLCFGWLTSFECMEQVVGVQVLQPTTLPRLHRWTLDFKQEPVIKENLPDSTGMLEHFQRVKKRFTLPNN